MRGLTLGMLVVPDLIDNEMAFYLLIFLLAEGNRM